MSEVNKTQVLLDLIEEEKRQPNPSRSKMKSYFEQLWELNGDDRLTGTNFDRIDPDAFHIRYFRGSPADEHDSEVGYGKHGCVGSPDTNAITVQLRR